MKNRMILGMVVLAAILMLAVVGFAGEKGNTTSSNETTTAIQKDNTADVKAGCAGHAKGTECPGADKCTKSCTAEQKAECKTSEKCKTASQCTPEEKAKCAIDTKKCCPGHK